MTRSAALDIPTFQHDLLTWYDRCRRTMPWRGSDDPYAIWLSEIMLQQTQVDTVKPYYTRFLERFPNVQTLAAADLQELLTLWQGLGYYSRAKNLHRAAQQIVERFAGQIPNDPQQLMTLPGIGRYTAGAIASIAFDLDEPVLDGNVIRVLCRIYRIADDPRKSNTEKHLWMLARKLIPAGRAGFFNQALMDLGATTCTPRNPRCDTCPVQGHCHARRAGCQADLPTKAAKKTIPHHTIVAAVIRDRGRILIDRRPDTGLLANLWEFPGGKVEPGEALTDALIREIREEVGLTIDVGDEIARIRHAYSHFKITMHVFNARRIAGTAKPLACAAVRWVKPAELANYPFPRANQKLLPKLLAE